jgi:hypothetical protein
MTGSHIIYKKTIDFEVSDAGEAREIQEEISRICKKLLPEIISEVFTEAISPESDLKLEEVIIDIGEVRKEYLEKDISNKVREALVSYLNSKKHLAVSSVNPQKVMEALIWFFSNGTLPWWANNKVYQSIDALFRKVLKDFSNDFIALIKANKEKAIFKRRLVNSITDFSYWELIRKLESKHCDFIFSYVKEIKEDHKRKPIVMTSEDGFLKEINYLVLSYVLLNVGKFEKKEFVRKQLKGISGSFGINYSELLNLLLETINSAAKQSADTFSLVTILNEISTEDFPNEFRPHERIHLNTGLPEEGSIDIEKLLFDFFKTGFLSGPVQNNFSYSVESLWIDWLDSLKPAEIKSRLIRMAVARPVQRLVHLFSGKQLSLLVSAIEPSELDFIVEHQHTLIESYKRGGKVLPENDFNKVLWEITLNFLVEDRGTVFNRKSFLKNSLEKISQVRGVNFQDLLELIIRHGEEHNLNDSVFYSVIREIGKEENLPLLDKEKKNTEDLTKEHTSVLLYIKEGIPFGENTEKTPSNSFGEISKRVLNTETANKELLRVLFSNAVSEEAFNRGILIYFNNNRIDLLMNKMMADISEWVELVSEIFEAVRTGGYKYKFYFTEISFFAILRDLMNCDLKNNNAESVWKELVKVLSKQLRTESGNILSFLHEYKILSARTESIKKQIAEPHRSIKQKQQEDIFQEVLKTNSDFLNLENIYEEEPDKFIYTLKSSANPQLLKETIFAIQSEEFILKLFNRLAREERAYIKELTDDLISMAKEFKGLFEDTKQFYQHLFQFAVWYALSSNSAKLYSGDFVKDFFSYWANKTSKPVAVLIKQTVILLPKLSEPLKTSLPFILIKWQKEETKHKELERNEDPENNLIKERKIHKRERENAGEEFPDSIFVPNAGLVILWPFIKRFLEMAGLVKENKFISEEAQNRALYLLQYLVVGNVQAEEYQLTLNKILCGLDWQYPALQIKEITEQEKQIAEGLLQAVIQQWNKLGSTSVDGLRGTFLWRNGKLFQEDGQWRLQIEKKTFDILLDHLPWSVSMIRFPWMEKVMSCEWR